MRLCCITLECFLLALFRANGAYLPFLSVGFCFKSVCRVSQMIHRWIPAPAAVSYLCPPVQNMMFWPLWHEFVFLCICQPEATSPVVSPHQSPPTSPHSWRKHKRQHSGGNTDRQPVVTAAGSAWTQFREPQTGNRTVRSGLPAARLSLLNFLVGIVDCLLTFASMTVNGTTKASCDLFHFSCDG